MHPYVYRTDVSVFFASRNRSWDVLMLDGRRFMPVLAQKEGVSLG